MRFFPIRTRPLVSIRHTPPVRPAHVWRMATAFLLASCVLLPDVAQAQSLAELYKAQYFRRQANRIFQQYGMRPHPRPYAHMPSKADTVREYIARYNPEMAPPPEPVRVAAPQFVVSKWKLVRKLERGWFQKEYADVNWAYVGSNWLTTLDTLHTKDLRARMEAHFGTPTMTLSEVFFREDLPREEFIEFEYWFVLNDSIPLKVMDVNGPFERGLVVASDQRYRDRLYDIKHAFLSDLIRSTRRSIYVDYYYNVDRRVWYRTGYDGARFFLTPISRPNLARGRPVLGDTESNGTARTNK